MKFSQRIGKVPVKKILQLESIDDDLKNDLWNIFYQYFYKEFYDNHYSTLKVLLQNLQRTFFRERVDMIPDPHTFLYNKISPWFFSAKWYEIYDFIEKIINYTDKWDIGGKRNNSINFKYKINEILELNLSGYRFVENQIIPISNEIELESIELS